MHVPELLRHGSTDLMNSCSGTAGTDCGGPTPCRRTVAFSFADLSYNLAKSSRWKARSVFGFTVIGNSTRHPSGATDFAIVKAKHLFLSPDSSMPTFQSSI